MNEQNDYLNCCNHYKTDKYQDGYLIIKSIKIKMCKNCKEVHLVCNWVWEKLFVYLLVLFWDGKVYLNEEREHNDNR